jgi:hypothetical protein
MLSDRLSDAVSAAGDGFMLALGAFLGLLYVVFLVVWIWATRFRPRD